MASALRIYIILTLIVCILLVFIHYTQSNYYIPKIVWCYWDSPELPLLIKQIHAHNVKKLKGFKVIMLNNTTISNYIDISKPPKNYETLGPAHRADWLRLKLLEKYGGVWMDASIIINNNDAMRLLYKKSVLKKSQLTVFSYNHTPEIPYVSHLKIPMYIENWFIMAPKHSTIIKHWLIEYELAMFMMFINYKKMLIEEDVIMTKIYSHPEDIYLTQHACLQRYLQKQITYTPPMVVEPAEKDMLYLKHNITSNDCPQQIMLKLQNRDPIALALPYIKLTKAERDTGIDITPFFEK